MSVQQLAEDWKKTGIESGDMILLHSSIKNTIRRYLRQKIKLTPDDILDSLLLAVGSEGTLLLPLFNFDFTSGSGFDIRSTPSQMGVLTEAARKREGAVRTGHPIYSFVALGKNADKFLSVDNVSGYAEDSPFGILHHNKAKVAVLGLPDQDSMTFYHYVEEMHNVSYRYYKKFTGNYTESNGLSSDKTYSLFVRNVEEGVLTDVDPMGELLWEKGLYHGFRPSEDVGLRWVYAEDIFNAVAEVIKSGNAKGLLYSIEGEE
ncbi:AAC(3) family N-acetyltransferase [Pelagibaculum spongiae]|uniref:Aminoglycoside N(3)-acetyltransferase n=1 Tax=Pelagibaculum spongiae TaxID=2080658 RepID=A0A2V1GV40_9GAMM|nr:AAC(3) family N-acetyltransferase [Pelagibaculum spongiae]PVZ70208.1 hypothetical protein DC094_06285 [Pelagibaculum spongiae]